MIDTDGSCPVSNVSCWLPPAAPCQLRIAGRAPSDGGDVSNAPAGPVGTYGEDPAACHAARAAPWLNGRPNGPLGRPGHREGVDAEVGGRGGQRARRVVRRQDIGEGEAEQPQRVAGLPRAGQRDDQGMPLAVGGQRPGGQRVADAVGILDQGRDGD